MTVAFIIPPPFRACAGSFFFLFYLIPSHCEVTNPYAISKFSLSLSFICVEILLQLAAFHIAISLAVVSQSISRLA